MNNPHQKALRVTYDDRASSFDDLLKLDVSSYEQHKNLQDLQGLFETFIGCNYSKHCSVLSFGKNAFIRNS